MEGEQLRRLRSVNESRLYHLFHKIPYLGERADAKIRRSLVAVLVLGFGKRFEDE
jgi:hypothetical protein